MGKIELKDISFSYPNGFLAVDNISITVEENQKVAIIGQNGAGKTTTVKMMNGLLRPQSGVITLDGEDISLETTANISKKVGYVFQNPDDQLFNQTVYDELSYTLKYENVEEREIEKIVSHTAELCHLTEYLKSNPYDLPLSIRKFVTIGIVIANNCDVVILDEPTAGQDLFGLQWLSEIIEILKAEGKTIITISHDMEFVADNFDRVIIMAEKQVIGDDSTNKIFWEHRILEKAYIKPTIITQLAQALGISNKIISMNDFVDYVDEMKRLG